MKAKDIKVGRWYETRVGIGVCLLGAAGRFPPACKFKIVAPFPRGECFVVPRDVLGETADPTTGETK